LSFSDRLIHSLAIVTPVPSGSGDEYGHATAGTPTTEYVYGLVQPRRASEIAQSTQAGEPFSDHLIFLESITVSQAAYIRDEPATNRRFEIVGIRSFEFGMSPHLEVDAKLVGNPEGPGVGS
jgi:hypothetical protein